MRIEFYDDSILIAPEDARDESYLEDVIGVSKGKVFCRVVELETGPNSKQLAIEITEFDEKIKRSAVK